MLDRTRPFGEVFTNGRSAGYVQDDRLFDHDGHPIDVPEPLPSPPPKRRGRPPKSLPPETE